MAGTAGELAIDLSAIADNYGRIRAMLGARAEAAGVVKADGYGLGAPQVAAALGRAGCRIFFVAHLEEAVALRPHLPGADIFVLNGAARGDEAEFAAHGVAPVLNSLGDVDAWAELCRARGQLPAALHLDTGMSRLGLPQDELDALADEPRRLAPIGLRFVMSHLACAEEPGHPMNAAQLAAFEAARGRLPPVPASLANSAGVFLGPAYALDLARPGIALYGANPTPGQANPMRGVVRLEARVLQVRHVDPPGTVGYGAARRLARRTKIATIAIGYADGYLRALSDRGACTVRGRNAPVLGRVSMDLVTLDVTDIPGVRAGDVAEVIGPSMPVDEVAAAAGIIAHEILTLLGRRYRRRYLGG